MTILRSEQWMPTRTARWKVDGVTGYYCVDCHFTTWELGNIAKHQENQSRHHSFRQRLNRRLLIIWWHMRLK